MVNDLKDDRLSFALTWCKKHKIKTYLNLNDLQSERKPVKKKKNPFLKENGGFDLIDEVVNYEQDKQFKVKDLKKN